MKLTISNIKKVTQNTLSRKNKIHAIKKGFVGNEIGCFEEVTIVFVIVDFVCLQN